MGNVIETYEAEFEKQTEKSASIFRIMSVCAAVLTVLLAVMEIICLFVIESKRSALITSTIAAAVVLVIMVLLLFLYFIARRKMIKLDRLIRQAEKREEAAEKARSLLNKNQ